MKQFFTKPCRVTVEIYDEVKYTSNPGECIEINYNNAIAFEVIEGEAAARLEAEMDGRVDDFHEYLRIYLADGETATFCNSYTDLFKF